MNSNIKKVITTINNMGELPKKIMLHGVQIACGLLLIALILYYVNTANNHLSFQAASTIFTTAKTGVTVFAEAIIGGFIVDFLMKKI